MRRASVLALQLAQRSSGASAAGAAAGQTGAASSLPHLLGTWQPGAGANAVRHFADHGEPPKVVPNPLQQIVPPVIKGAGLAYNGLVDGLAATYKGLQRASTPAISYFADNVLLSGNFLDMKDLDVAKWAHWLASSGYTNRTGWDKIVAWGKANAQSLGAPEVSALVEALHTVDRYDRELFSQLATVIQDKFMEFETEGMCKIAAAYAENDHFDVALFDDIADSIAYCNHYLAPTAVSLQDIAAVFSAYAKYGHDRADLFVTLSRAVFEDRLRALDKTELRKVTMELLRAFNKLEFWPDCSEALLVAAQLNPGAFSSEQAELAAITSKLEGYAGGKLPWLDGGYKDWEHFHGRPFGDYNLYVFRDEMTPQYYKPSDVKVWKESP